MEDRNQLHHHRTDRHRINFLRAVVQMTNRTS